MYFVSTWKYERTLNLPSCMITRIADSFFVHQTGRKEQNSILDISFWNIHKIPFDSGKMAMMYSLFIGKYGQNILKVHAWVLGECHFVHVSLVTQLFLWQQKLSKFVKKTTFKSQCQGARWILLCPCVFGDGILLLWLQKCGRTNEAYSEGVDPFEEREKRENYQWHLLV